MNDVPISQIDLTVPLHVPGTPLVPGLSVQLHFRLLALRKQGLGLAM